MQATTGDNLPAFVSTAESASFAAQGRWREALETDKEWQGITARLMAADAPGTFLRFSEWFSPIQSPNRASARCIILSADKRTSSVEWARGMWRSWR